MVYYILLGMLVNFFFIVLCLIKYIMFEKIIIVIINININDVRFLI